MLERQQPAKVGSALKTISARLRGIDKANNLPKLSRLLGEIGVKVESASGGFRNIYDILGDLSDALSGSNDEFQRQLILEELAGKRRANILAGLLNNFQKAREVVSKTSDSINDASESQQKLLDTSAGVISQMSGNWSVFADNVIESDLVKKSLTGINWLLKDINNEMADEDLREKFIEDLKIDPKLDMNLIGYTPFGVVGDEEIEEIEKLIAKYKSEDFANAVDKKNELLRGGSEEAADEYVAQLEKQKSAMAEHFNAVRIAGRQQATNYKKLITLQEEYDDSSTSRSRRNEIRNIYIELEDENKSLEKSMENSQRAMATTHTALASLGIGYGELESVLKSFKGEEEEVVTATEKVTRGFFIQSSEFEWYVKRFSDLTDEQKTDMQNMLSEDRRITLEQVQLTKDRIDALEIENSAFGKIIEKRISMMNVLEGAEQQRNEQMIIRLRGLVSSSGLGAENSKLDSLEARLKKIQGADKKYFGDKDKSDSAKELAEPLSELEIILRDVRQEVDLLDSELSRTDGYQAQLDIINQLIIKRDAEKVAIDNLAVAKKKEMEAEKKDKALKQDLMEEYQKLLVESDKVETSIYKLEQSMVDLDDTQNDLIKSGTSDYISDLSDAYDEYFDKQKEEYEDDLDDFKRSQEEKIKVVDKALKKLKDMYAEEKFIDEEQDMLDAIAKLEERKYMLRLDNSLKAGKDVFEINKELEDKNEELDDFRRDREFTLQEDDLNDKKDKLEEETTAKEKEYDKQIELLDTYQSEINKQLESFEGIWENFSIDLGGSFKTNVDGAINSMYSKLSEFTKEFNKVNDTDFGDEIIDETPRRDSKDSDGGSSRGTRTSYLDTTGSIRTGYIKDGVTTDRSGNRVGLGSVVKTAGGTYQRTANGSVRRDDLASMFEKHHEGGIAGAGSFKGMSGTEALEYTLKGNEINTVLQKGEGIFTQPQMKDIGNSGGNTIENLIKVENLKVTASNGYDVEQVGSDLVRGAKKEYAKKGL